MSEMAASLVALGGSCAGCLPLPSEWPAQRAVAANSAGHLPGGKHGEEADT